MPTDQMPRSIAQIQDFSARAGDRIIDILGKQQADSPANILLEVVNKATRAYDSDQMAKAAALQESMRAQGFGPDAIRNALSSAGFRAGIVGSKELQDRYEKANQAQLAKTQLDNTLRVQALNEQGSALAADLDRFVRTAGAENAYMWFQDHQKQLDANPYAFDKVMGYAKSANLSLVPYTSPATDNTLINLTPANVESYANAARKKVQEAQALGIDTSLSPEEAVKLSDIEAWIADQGKQRGYSGTSAFSDFRDNMMKAYNILRAEAPNAAPEAILQAMKLNMDHGGILWNWFGADQEDINIDPAKEWLRTQSTDWYAKFNDAFKAKKALKVLEPAMLNNQVLNTSTALNARIKQIKDLEATGQISSSRARDMINNVTNKANTSFTDVLQAIKETSEIYNRKLS